MPVYSYHGCDSTGASERGTISASSEKLAFETLQSRGITVFELSIGAESTVSKIPWYRQEISFWGNELPYEDQAATADLLATLFGAGLSATEVLRIAALSSERSEVKRHFERVGQRVADGSSFSEAFEAENRLFSPLFISFLKVSDTANTLPQLLKELAMFFQKQNTVRQKVVSALIYPAILVVAAIALLLVVIFYLAPSLEPIFTSVNRKPPGTLTLLLSVNEGLRSYWFIVVGGSLGFIFLALAALQIPRVKSTFSRTLLRFPVVGKLMRLTTLSRLAQATELLLSSGQPLAEALRIAAQIMVGSSGFGSRFEEAAEAIEAGLPASTAFDGDPVIPPTFKELFRIGEETNRLPATLSALSESMSAQADRQSQRLLNLLTPALTLILGLGIGFLIYTLMGAILEVNELAF